MWTRKTWALFSINSVWTIILLVSFVHHPGGRHAIYNVIEEEYDHMTQALIQTFAHILGESVLNAETQKAWKAVLSQFSQQMIAAGTLVLFLKISP
jgi:hemoglobin-like flavoprotein